MKIALLSDNVINQIAAGEVIENPASVVKELVDNAIDAGAKRIEIDIQAGGQQLIQIQDDGCGMSREDIQMCLLRHATSKLKDIHDLDSLQTMGFRGEALAAIAAISKLEIRTSDGFSSTLLQAEGGQIRGLESCARNLGTTVTIRSLFFNTPARKKFQKSPQANTTQVVRMMQSLALSHPNISFCIRSQGQNIFDVHSSDWKGRVEKVLGKEEVEKGIWFEEVLAKFPFGPKSALALPDSIFSEVPMPHLDMSLREKNEPALRSSDFGREANFATTSEKKSIFGWLGSVNDARATRIGQHFILNQRPVFSSLVSKAIREGYGTRLLEGSHPSFVLYLECPADSFDVNVHPQKKEVRFRDENNLFCQIRQAIQNAFLPHNISAFSAPCTFSPSTDPWEIPASSMGHGPIAKCEVSSPGLYESLPLGRGLAVIGSFLIAQRSKEIVVVDLRNSYENRALKTEGSQALLFPISLTLTHEEEIHFEELIHRFHELGITAQRTGPKQLNLETIPAWLSESDAMDFFIILKEDVVSGASLPDSIRRFCRSSKVHFSLEEAEFLWKKGNAREIVLEEEDLMRILNKKQ